MYIDNARKPKGVLGRIMLTRMNRGTHARLAEWALTLFEQEKKTLDIGCGGGANIARMLKRGGEVYGLDYSPVSVSKSARHNRKAVVSGRCKVVCGDVTAMPFEDDTFDMATAFETVYFWQPIEVAFAEVNRILKEGGKFGVFNDADGSGELSENAKKLNLRIYTPDELTALFENAGFGNIAVHRFGKFVAVIGEKPISLLRSIEY